MADISSEAKKAGLPAPEKPVKEMTAEELKKFRERFDPDMMGFDGCEGCEKENEESGEKGDE